MDGSDTTAPQAMHHATVELSHGRADRIFFRLVVGCTLGLVIAMGIDGWMRTRHQDQPAAQWMRALDLSQPALWSAGSAKRMPMAVHPAVALRHAPQLPAIEFEPSAVLKRHP